MLKKKILMLACGGTIAMGKNEEGVLVPMLDPDQLLNMVPEVRDFVDLDVKDLFNIPSANARFFHWTEVAKQIYNSYHEYDGFVITHGTDTMADTATAVSLALGKKLNKPVVFTGAQAYPGYVGSDAKFNLVNAFKVATSDVSEVMICFGHFVLRGSRAIKMTESGLNAFFSPAFPPLAEIRTDLLWSPYARRRRGTMDEDLKLEAEFEEGVINIRLNVGLTPKMIEMLLSAKNLKPSIKGIIFESLGAGNVPEYYLPVINDAIRKDIPVVVTSPFLGGKLGVAHMDTTGVKAVRAGIILAGDMTSVASYVKLMWALAKIKNMSIFEGKEDEDMIPLVRKIMQTDYTGEITVEEQNV